jgi:hypothetical protein
VVEASYAPIHEAMRALVKRAIKSGELRKDVDPVDLLRALSASHIWSQVVIGRQAPGAVGGYPNRRFAANQIEDTEIDIH